jgi:calcineurin-like phosphoesterase family protein
MNFYTADPHFFHENILKFCNRPFQTVDALNRHILSNYQSVMTTTIYGSWVTSLSFTSTPHPN